MLGRVEWPRGVGLRLSSPLIVWRVLCVLRRWLGPLDPCNARIASIVTVLIWTVGSDWWHGILRRAWPTGDRSILIPRVGRPGVRAGSMIRPTKTSLALEPMPGLSDLLLGQTSTANKAAFRLAANLGGIIATKRGRRTCFLVLRNSTIRRGHIWLGGLTKVRTRLLWLEGGSLGRPNGWGKVGFGRGRNAR